ncbi:hypothetical protein Eta_0045 [Serratia phage Eta]|uniref:Uncharacterized protein n=1 Tax=Serratia phage Eta TaxID=1282995 RepID=R9VX76_9CAUD|nr:hypothetical protein Eta_0045 [Serratia phage Eta]AGN89491.1 hypothetical protein Eta_0045 [Serratia phage Eta]
MTSSFVLTCRAMGGVTTIMATSETNPHDAHGKVINVWWRGFEPPSRSARFFPCCIHQLPHHNEKSTEAPGISRSQGWHCRNALTCCVPIYLLEQYNRQYHTRTNKLWVSL